MPAALGRGRAAARGAGRPVHLADTSAVHLADVEVIRVRPQSPVFRECGPISFHRVTSNRG
jgi:hypothetical protein